MELYSSNIKIFLIFSQKKAVLIFQETETLKKTPYIFSKESLYFGKRKPQKNSLYFRK